MPPTGQDVAAYQGILQMIRCGQTRPNCTKGPCLRPVFQSDRLGNLIQLDMVAHCCFVAQTVSAQLDNEYLRQVFKLLEPFMVKPCVVKGLIQVYLFTYNTRRELTWNMFYCVPYIYLFNYNHLNTTWCHYPISHLIIGTQVLNAVHQPTSYQSV